jgi:hypothetical protein
MLKNEPALDDIRPPEYPQVGDLLVVQGDKRMGLSKGLHSLAITRKRDEFLFHCSTLDGEKDDILIWAFEIIDWRKSK